MWGYLGFILAEINPHFFAGPRALPMYGNNGQQLLASDAREWLMEAISENGPQKFSGQKIIWTTNLTFLDVFMTRIRVSALQ